MTATGTTITRWRTYRTIRKLEPDATVLEGLPVEMTAAERGATEQVKKWLKAVGKLSAGETHTDGESKRYDTVM